LVSWRAGGLLHRTPFRPPLLAIHSDQFRNVKIGLAVFVLLFFGGFYGWFFLVPHRSAGPIGNDRERGETETMLKPDASRRGQLDRLRQQDPVAAVGLADQILAKPETDYERTTTKAEYPMLLARAFSSELKAGRRSEAEAWRTKLMQRFPASREAELTRTELGRYLGKVAQDALQRGDVAGAEVAMTDLFREPGHADNDYAFTVWADFHKQRWNELRDKQPAEAMTPLLAAATTIPHVEHLRSLSNDISFAPHTFDDLTAAANGLAGTPRRHAALALWWAQVLRLGEGYSDPVVKRMSVPARQALAGEIQAKLTAGLIELGDRLRAGEQIPFVLVDARVPYQAVVDLRRDKPEEAPALVKLIEYEAAVLEKSARPITALALDALSDVSTDARPELLKSARDANRRALEIFSGPGMRLWSVVLQRPTFNPWTSAPARVVERIDAKLPEAERRQKLIAYYGQQPHRIPVTQLNVVETIFHSTRARAGLLALLGGSSEAYDVLREVLRETEQPELRAGVAAWLKARLVKAAEKSEFSLLYGLAGFYFAEVGFPAADDPLRNQLRVALVKARDSFKGKRADRMQQIFMDALLAEGFAHEELGEQARNEAFELAFAQVAAMKPEADDVAVHPPSGVANLSVDRIDNSTAHHLLVFYRGPERFMVHSLPYRRGTAAFASGDYELVVLCPDGAIEPFYGRVQLHSALRLSNYYVESSRNPRPAGFTSGSDASGDYVWLRRPPAAQAIPLNPRSGLVGSMAK
jgi:hypothetical protein